MTLQEIENTYGANLAEEIKERIESAKGIDYMIDISEITDSILGITFATHAFAYLYEVNPESGRIISQVRISYSEARNALSLMNHMWDKAQQIQNAKQG